MLAPREAPPACHGACGFRGPCQGRLRAQCTCWHRGAGPPGLPYSAPPPGDWQLHDAPVHRPAVPCSPLPLTGHPPTHLFPALPLPLHAPTPGPSHLSWAWTPPLTSSTLPSCPLPSPSLHLCPSSPVSPPPATRTPLHPPSSPPPPWDAEPVLGTGVQWRRGAHPHGRGAGGSVDGEQTVPDRCRRHRGLQGPPAQASGS